MSREPEIKGLEVEADFDVDTKIVIGHLVSSLMKVYKMHIRVFIRSYTNTHFKRPPSLNMLN